jgi:glutathione synthase/RimK-type ligase-like ATP-grasp enzyme
MILFYGHDDDSPLELAISAAQELDIDYLVVDQRDANLHSLTLDVGPHGVDGALTTGDTEIALSDIDAVYARPLGPDGHAHSLSEHAVNLQQLFMSWFDVADCLVVSRPSAMDSNASKPFQLQLIAAAGFAVPDTLVTNRCDLARHYWHRRGDVVFKSTSGIRSIVRRLNEQRAANLERVAALPTQFQERVVGPDVRVHVVGDVVFAARVRSEGDDYRYANQEGLSAEIEPIDLPSEVARLCVSLARDLELPFCGIDLRQRSDNSYVCFEVNPMPGYSYYESHTGAPISRALVELLAERAA